MIYARKRFRCESPSYRCVRDFKHSRNIFRFPAPEDYVRAFVDAVCISRISPSLNFYLYGSGLVTSPLCPFCNEEETVHFLSCRWLKIPPKRILEQTLHNLGSQFTEATIFFFLYGGLTLAHSHIHGHCSAIMKSIVQTKRISCYILSDVTPHLATTPTDNHRVHCCLGQSRIFGMCHSGGKKKRKRTR